MGEVIWVEILSPHRDVLARHRCELDGNGEAHLGRAYDNDVLIDDVFVAPRHLRISRDESGRLVADDLGTINGLFLDHQTEKRSRIPLDGHTPIRIGRTFLRICDASTAVVAEREEPPAARTWHAVFAFSVILIALTVLEAWLEDTDELKLSTYVFSLFAMGAFVIGWATSWSVQARIFAGIARFDRHLYIATSGFLALLLVEAVVEYLAYAFSLSSLSLLESSGFWIWLAILSFFHLREIGPRHLVLKGAVVGTLAVLGIGAQMLTKAEAGALVGTEVGVTALKPPWLRIVPAESQQEFFAEAESLRPELDKARTEEPPSGSLLDSLDLGE